MYKHFADDTAVAFYIESELLATLKADLDNMERGECHQYTDEDREEMRNRIADIEAYFEKQNTRVPQFVIAYGNAFDGLTLEGPFDDYDAALKEAEKTTGMTDWRVVEVKEIEAD